MRERARITSPSGDIHPHDATNGFRGDITLRVPVPPVVRMRPQPCAPKDEWLLDFPNVIWTMASAQLPAIYCGPSSGGRHDLIDAALHDLRR